MITEKYLINQIRENFRDDDIRVNFTISNHDINFNDFSALNAIHTNFKRSLLEEYLLLILGETSSPELQKLILKKYEEMGDSTKILRVEKGSLIIEFLMNLTVDKVVVCAASYLVIKPGLDIFNDHMKGRLKRILGIRERKETLKKKIKQTKFKVPRGYEVYEATVNDSDVTFKIRKIESETKNSSKNVKVLSEITKHLK